MNNFTFFLNSALSGIKDNNKVLRKIGQEMKNEISFRFRNSVSPDGQKWKPSRRASTNGGKTLVNTAALKNSFSTKISGNEVACGTKLKYARIHNFGGTIKAKSGKALTIPIDPLAAGKRARNFENAFIIKSKTGKLLLVEKAPVGLRILYLLTKSVTIPARPFLGINQDMIRKFEKIQNDAIISEIRRNYRNGKN